MSKPLQAVLFLIALFPAIIAPLRNAMADLGGATEEQSLTSCGKLLIESLPDHIQKAKAWSGSTTIREDFIKKIDFLKTFLRAPRSSEKKWVMPPFAADEGEKGTVARKIKDLKESGKPIELRKILSELKIPQKAWSFYDSEGRFNYRPDKALELSLENGDAPLKAIRINLANHDRYEVPQRTAESNKRLFENMARAMRLLPKLELWVVLNDANSGALDNLIRNMPEEVRPRVKRAPLSGPDVLIYEWAQDGSKPGLEEGTTVATRLEDSPGDQRLAYSKYLAKLEEKGFVKVQHSIFRYDGGDLVVGSKNIFVGTHVVANAMADFKITRDMALRALTAEFGKPVVEVGVPQADGTLEPQAFHIDLAMSVARDHQTGEEVILVDDPAALFYEKSSVAFGAGEGSDSKLQANLKHSIEKMDKTIRDEWGGEWTEREKLFVKDMAEQNQFRLAYQVVKREYLVDSMQALGYRVVRVPGFTLVDLDQRSVNYTNSIFSEKLALIPEMNVRFLDKIAQNIFKRLGYEVIPMNAAETLFGFNGGIRCASETYRCSIVQSSASSTP